MNFISGYTDHQAFQAILKVTDSSWFKVIESLSDDNRVLMTEENKMWVNHLNCRMYYWHSGELFIRHIKHFEVHHLTFVGPCFRWHTLLFLCPREVKHSIVLYSTLCFLRMFICLLHPGYRPVSHSFFCLTQRGNLLYLNIELDSQWRHSNRIRWELILHVCKIVAGKHVGMNEYNV